MMEEFYSLVCDERFFGFGLCATERGIVCCRTWPVIMSCAAGMLLCAASCTRHITQNPDIKCVFDFRRLAPSVSFVVKGCIVFLSAH